MVVNIESQRKNNAALSAGIGDPATLMSNTNLGNGNNSFKPRNNFGRSIRQCDYCHLKGHTQDTCYKLCGYPADFKAKRRVYSGPHVKNISIASGFQTPDAPQSTLQFSSPAPFFT